MDLDKDETNLLNLLNSLQKKYQTFTKNKYNRINPFNEDIFDWKERGVFWTENDNVTIYNSVTINGDVTIGNNSWIGSFVNLDGIGGLSIGEYCSISSGCQILTHDTVAWALTGGLAAHELKPTSIGNNCFIGTKAIIIAGVKLGDRCIVAAGSVVTKSYSNNSIIAGVPAKKIGIVEVNEETNEIIKTYF